METYIKASEILNNIANALNKSDHIQVQRLLAEFDGTLNGHKLPLDYLYRRIWAEAELSARIGNYIRGINAITRNLSIFEGDNEMRFKLLLKAGKLECLSSRTGVSSNFLIDALGLAEEIGNKRLKGLKKR